MSISFKPVKPLLQAGSSHASRWFSYIGLGVGVLLLLCSIQMFVNIEDLLRGNVIRKNGFDFISVTKKITNDNMGDKKATMFSDADIAGLKKQPEIADAAPLIATNFQMELSAAGIIPFQTNLFLESIDNEFLDTVPPNFSWQPGQKTVPIIIASEFLEVFNTLGPGNGLPQVSPETAMGVPIIITCHAANGTTEQFNGKCVGFTDRINSALVPSSFIKYANEKFGGSNASLYTRAYIKTKDANNATLLNFLDSKNYNVNRDATKFGRAKQVFEGIFTGLGVFGILVVVLALMLFSFYLQLVIARSKESLQLLLTLGYSPAWLGNNVSKKFIPVYILIVLIALAATQAMQWAFHHLIMYDRPELNTIIHWSVAATGILLILLSIVINFRLVKKLLYKLG